jgi:hypothetical protein
VGLNADQKGALQIRGLVGGKYGHQVNDTQSRDFRGVNEQPTMLV